MDEFDDIFMNSSDEEDHGTTSVVNHGSTKKDGSKKADEDVNSIGSSASSSSSSSSSSSDNDDDSVSSKDDKHNGSNVNKDIGEESDDDGDMLRDELDDDALVEFFSDPTPLKVNDKEKENNNGDGGSLTDTTASVDASLDAEELVDLEEDDSSTEGTEDEDAGSTVQTTQSSSALNKENNPRNAKQDYTISYNGEKKASPPTEEIFDESSDEDDSLSIPRREEDEAEADVSPIAKPKQNSRKPVFNPYQKQQQVKTTQQQESPLQTPHRPTDSARVATKADEPIISGSTKVTSLPDISSSSQKDEVQILRIERSHFKPPAFTRKAEPIVHKLSSQNRPIHNRRNIPVNNVFSGPVRNFWQSKFQSFNHMQSEMANVLANSDDNVIVSAPTGAGKTALFEMAMARLFASNLVNGQSQQGVSRGVKVVYIAPNKALCDERQEDWSKRLADVDRRIVCTTITGDDNATSSYGEIAKSQTFRKLGLKTFSLCILVLGYRALIKMSVSSWG